MSENILPEVYPYSPPESADGTLVVVVCRARHLPNRRKLDKQNPYVTLRIGTAARKTPSHFRAGQTPEWTHEVRFDLNRDRKPLMIVDVLDETKNEPTPIGNVEIDCSKIFANPENQEHGKFIYDNWYDLNMFGKRAGMIYLEMTFYPSAPILPPKIVNHNVTVKEEESIYSPRNSQSKYAHEVSSHHSHPHHHTLNHQLSAHSGQPQLQSHSHSPLRISPNRSHSPTKYYDSYNHRHSPSKSEGNLTYSHSESQIPTPAPVAKQRTAMDDVFVSSQNSEKSTFLKHLSFLKNSASTNETDLSDNYPEYASPDKNKKHSKWYKFTNKFQSKEPISTLWQGEKTPEPESEPEVSQNITFPKPMQHLLYPDDEDDTDDRDFMAPLPPPHLVESNISSKSSTTSFKPFPPAGMSTTSSRKPPPGNDFSTLNLTTSIPFSADTIGLTDDELPTQVYLLDKKVQSLTYSSPHEEEHHINPNEIDPKYYAPTPSAKLNTKFRLQGGHARKQDLAIDFRTDETGYLGNGKFSPSVFERINQNHHNDYDDDQENKPKVPPKIPQGLTNQEYYAIAKDQYLRDLNGQRM